jgi:hypothetical protein
MHFLYTNSITNFVSVFGIIQRADVPMISMILISVGSSAEKSRSDKHESFCL